MCALEEYLRRSTSGEGHFCRSQHAKVDTPRTNDQWSAFELFGNGYVVSGDHKAIRVRTGMYEDGRWHLYNIKTDPGETRPLDEEQPERLAELVAIYKAYAEQKGTVPVRDDWSPWHGFTKESK